MKKLKYLILPFLLTCAHFTPQTEILSFRDQYFSITKQPLINVTFRFSYFIGTKEKGRVAGLCSINSKKNTRIIEIDIGYYASLTKPQRRFLIFHELEHCVKRRGHDYNMLPDGCPQHIMYPVLATPRCAFKYEDVYIKQLTE